MKNETTITNRYSYTTCVKCSKCPLIMCTSSILLETNLYQKFYHACDSQNTDTCNSMHRNHKQIKNVMTQNFLNASEVSAQCECNRMCNIQAVGNSPEHLRITRTGCSAGDDVHRSIVHGSEKNASSLALGYNCCSLTWSLFIILSLNCTAVKKQTNK